jgi:putative ABC transport system permease protein
MFRTALRSFAARKFRLLATGVAVMLGVAFMAGTLVLTDTVNKTFDDLFVGIYETTDAVVRGEGIMDHPDGFGEQRGKIDESVLDLVASVDGVRAAEAEVFGYAQIVDKAGEPLGNPSLGPPTIGTNWIEDDELNVVTLVDGRAPRANYEVAIDKMSADDAGYVVGDTATVLVQGGPRQVEVVGILRFENSNSMAGATFAAFPMDTARELVGEPGKFDDVVVAAEEGVSQDEIAERIAAVLPDGVEVVTGAAVTEESQDAIAQVMSFFSSFMLVFAVIALLVGGFMIFNAFSITVLQRTKENALLRAVGASKRQVLLAVTVEALLVGVVASLIGLAAGVLVAGLLQGLLGAMGFDIPTTTTVFTLGTAVTSFFAGVLVTLVASISPARKAAKIPPVAAMRDVAVGSTGYGSKERVIVGLVVLLAGIGALVFGLFGDASNALMVVGGGALLVFFGVSILGRTIALPLSRVIGWPLPRLRGISGNLARENSMRNPKRTAATASALMIGVGLVSFITIFASSAKASFAESIDKVFMGDFVVTHNSAGGMSGSGGVDPSLTAAIAALPETDTVSPIRFGIAEFNGDPTYAVATDKDTGFELFDVAPLVGEPADLVEGTIAVFEDTAEKEGLAVGDTIPATFPETGPTELTIAMIYGESPAEGDWLIGMETYDAHYSSKYDAQVFIKAAEGVEPDAVLAAIEGATASYPGVKVLDQTEYKADQMAFLDQLLGLVYALLALAIIIALLGIANTLGLSILERVREVGLLRAVGMTQSQLRSTIRWESVIIALQGTLLGLVIGSFFGWALTSALREEGLGVFSYPTSTVILVVVLAALAGVAAAIFPARRAAKMDVLASVSAE